MLTMKENLHDRLTLLNEKLSNNDITPEELIEYKQLLELSNAIFRVHQIRQAPPHRPTT